MRVLEVGGERLECFYHHLFTTDRAYLRLAAELGLADAIEWLPSRMGIWTHGRLWDFGTPGSLLRFRPLPWPDKVRFALSTLALRHARRPERFEDVTAARWLLRHQGRRAWETVWGPLLEQKFGPRAGDVAMVWLWRKISLRGRSRGASGLQERLGYMRGSFARLVEALAERVGSGAGRLELGRPVRHIRRAGNGFELEVRGGTHRAPVVLVATQLPEYLEIAGELLPEAERERLGRIECTAALCTVLELDRPLTPYYWLNVADPDMPFGGLIEHTNYVPRERYAGRHVLYVSNYLFRDDPLYHAPLDEVLATYLPALERIRPGFDRSWILAAHHFRAESAQPVVVPGYRQLRPAFRTPVRGLYLATMAQIYPEDRGQSYAVEYGERVAGTIAADLG